MTNHVVVSSHGQRARRFALVFALSITGFILGFDLLVLWVGDGAFARGGGDRGNGFGWIRRGHVCGVIHRNAESRNSGSAAGGC